MVNSKTFDLTVNAFGNLVAEDFGRKRKPDGQINSDQTKKRRVSDVENILPPEMVEKILKLLKLKEICQAQLVCKRWKDIIVKGNLVKKVAGKMLE